MRRLTLVLVALAALLPASALARITLTGQTSQDRPVKVRVATDRRAVERFDLTWRASCSDGRPVTSAFFARDSSLRSRRFHRTGSARLGLQGALRTSTFRFDVRGRVDGGRASGSFTARASLRRGGRTIVTCRTPVIRWRASR